MLQAAASPTPSTVLATVMTGLDSFIDRQGGDSAAILARAGLKRDVSTPNAPIPLRDFCTALNSAASQTGNDNFGLLFGQNFAPEGLGLLGYLALSSADLGQALGNMAEAFPLHQQASLLTLTSSGGLCRLNYKVAPGLLPDRRQDAELSLGMFMNLMKRALGKDWAPEAVHFEHAKPADWLAHSRLFTADVRFGQPCNALLFRADVLNTPMPGADATLQAIMRHSLRQIGKAAPASGPLEQVRTEIIRQLPKGYPHLSGVADAVQIPAWTLQRRLAEEGLCFKDIVDDIRRELAPQHLRARHVKISEVAFRLGYADLSAFTRAFQRWYGMPPRLWRNHHAPSPISDFQGRVQS